MINAELAVSAHRVVIGVAERMPDLGLEFYENGPMLGSRLIARYLDRMVAEGKLAIDDTYLAAVQFLDLCQATLTRPRLFRMCRHSAERRGDPARRRLGDRDVHGALRHQAAGLDAKQASASDLPGADALAMSGVEPRIRDDHRADIGPDIRNRRNNQIAEERGPEQLE